MLQSDREDRMYRWWIAIASMAAFAAEIPGEFRLQPDRSSGTLVLQLTRRDTLVDANRVLRVEPSRLSGLSPDPFQQVGIQRFQLVREAGTFFFEGRSDDGIVRGTFRFVERGAFVAQLKGVVPNWYEPGTIFEYAVQDRTAPQTTPFIPTVLPQTAPKDQYREMYLRALKESGYPLLRPDLERLRIHNVSPDLLRQMKLSGYDTVSTSDMVKLQTYGITSADVLTFQVRGLNNLSADEMVKLKISGIPDNSAQPRP